MPSTPRDPVDAIRAPVARALARVGPGVYGVACSGGPDSLALADATIDVAGPSCVVVTVVDHGLTAASAVVAAAVAAWARARGAETLVRRVDVNGRGSIERAARVARYAALSAVADELGLVCVLLGHSARDQAETVLMRVLRGTGPAGLAAMADVRDRFVRPLLATSRETIEAYVAARALPAWEDPMNADPRFFRARVRHELLPGLRRENPALDDALVRLARSAREWLEVIDAQAQPLARWPVDCVALRQQPAAIRKRVLALALERAGVGYDAIHLDQCDALVTAPPHGEIAIDLPGARLVRSYELLNLAPRAGAASPPADAPSADAVPQLATTSPDTRFELRTWTAGDRMRPAGLRGHSRKLSDVYIDAKLPRSLRRTARVLVRVSDQTIVWAEHVGVAFGERAEDLPLPAGTAGTF